MTIIEPILKGRFEGCLLGLAVGDALGGKFEAQSADALRARFPTVEHLIAYPQEEIWYTDDTQMAIGVCEALIERGEIVEEVLCRAFVANYVPSRGYGRGARAVLDAMEDGRDHRQVAERHFPGGSFGNGAAMRVAPVGLLFRDDRRRLWEQARLSALPTHLHPLGVEGARLTALAVAPAPARSNSTARTSLPNCWPPASQRSTGPNWRLPRECKCQRPRRVGQPNRGVAFRPDGHRQLRPDAGILRGDDRQRHLAGRGRRHPGRNGGSAVRGLPRGESPAESIGRPAGEQPQRTGVHPAACGYIVRRLPSWGGEPAWREWLMLALRPLTEEERAEAEMLVSITGVAQS